MRDEGMAPRVRRSGAGRKPLQAAVVKSDGGERCRWGGKNPASVRSGETSASKPPMNCRNSIVDVETGIGGHSGISAGGVLKPGPRGIRLEGGVNPDQALARNVGTCRRDAKGTIQVGQPGEEPVPMRGTGTELLVVVSKVS